MDPGKALWSLRDHHLLPEAEACVRQHLPDLYNAAAVSEETVTPFSYWKVTPFSYWKKSVVVINFG